MKRILTMALLAAALAAQTPPEFDVASVKRDPWPESGGFVGITVRGDTLTAQHQCLYGLVEFAYNLKSDHLSGGPPWAKCGVLAYSDLYQVVAKAAGNPPPPKEQFQLMLRTLLADRFRLKIHHVEKDLPTYNLVVAPHSAKLKESPDDAKFWMQQDGRLNGGRSTRATATHVTMAQFVEQFEHYSGRPLFDHTGLKGAYDFVLEWDWETPAAVAPDGQTPDMVGQLFAAAIEKQLGLKLESSTAPFDTVVIDSAEKPSQN